MGHEFTSLVLALLCDRRTSAEGLRTRRCSRSANLEGDFAFETYFSLSCHNCPDVVQALTLLALFNLHVTATLIEGGAFQQEVDARGVMAVPATFLNGEMYRQRQDERRGTARQARHPRGGAGGGGDGRGRSRSTC